ncbi:MAG: hypothetical protein ACXVBM_18295, partial [Flavisolibacter sp.]
LKQPLPVTIFVQINAWRPISKPPLKIFSSSSFNIYSLDDVTIWKIDAGLTGQSDEMSPFKSSSRRTFQ